MRKGLKWKQLRFVFDTNVIISAALFFDSVPGRAFQWARQNGTLLVSWDLAQELKDVLSREYRPRLRCIPDPARSAFVFLRNNDTVRVKGHVKAL